MRQVIIDIAMSLDGFIADKNGSVDWLGGDGSDKENFGSFPEFMETVDTVVLGYTTYHQIVTELSPTTWPLFSPVRTSKAFISAFWDQKMAQPWFWTPVGSDSHGVCESIWTPSGVKFTWCM